VGSPLNSNDDIDSDEDDPEASNDFETRDVIVCQWEKVRCGTYCLWVGVR